MERHWLNNFVHRHKNELSLRKAKEIKSRNKLENVSEQLELFLGALTQRRKEISFAPDCIFNIDETRLVEVASDDDNVRLEWQRRPKASRATSHDSFFGTFVPVVSASGRVFVERLRDPRPSSFRRKGQHKRPSEAGSPLYKG